MPDLMYLLAFLMCPIIMGAMMLMMMRGSGHKSDSEASSQPPVDEVAQLRVEVERLRTEQGTDSTRSAP